jgi:hypothetical protein
MPGVKQTGREADHSPPSIAEVKNVWSCNYAPQYVMAWCLIKQQMPSWIGTLLSRDNFTFSLYGNYTKNPEVKLVRLKLLVS